ncbi:RlpA-like double-psi beta-barrel-protein domain-containing protein-containing protein [Phakopsora pachyrhizi]|uniref:RlpA-like double-psi beta-barrel-protein domain-containing protein-containing protein n=2 Tax=Phakopsora pachyrhizi TaxID=170000 RepID=A0AAV0B1J0_PHAPC|nr:RlpA-like double-psi beta-barrel-protein domain-containing protein-containing protein [Phakopsora pachyrhizi]KAI8445899.1 RlpA-like double-psi beta-barrel-protein domain-containing protein-containing protein [Phakopsora pachyrhizi]CAH7677119.1 RlpA-like double-psi beta-barrel-protein domain-containing protein-containing protein [Phakopsora pachyrhizi]
MVFSSLMLIVNILNVFLTLTNQLVQGASVEIGRGLGRRQANLKGMGQATFYTPGLGACGETHTESEMVVAISKDLFQSLGGASSNPNQNPVCGKTVTASYQGKSCSVKIIDLCMSCAQGDLDLSPAAFKQLSDLSAGRISGVTWG